MKIEWVMNSERIGVDFVNFGLVLREIEDFGVRVLGRNRMKKKNLCLVDE